jgi:hypothetical protein
VGVAGGAGCVSIGVGVSDGAGGLGLAGTPVGDGNGDGVGVTLGGSVDVGRGVFVAVARATRVLVGVGVTAGAPGAHRTISNPTRPAPTRKNPSHRCLFLAQCHILCGFPPRSNPAHYTREPKRLQAIQKEGEDERGSRRDPMAAHLRGPAGILQGTRHDLSRAAEVKSGYEDTSGSSQGWIRASQELVCEVTSLLPP